MKDLSPQISLFLDTLDCQGLPHLVFSTEDILSRTLQISRFCKENSIEIFFAVKACGHRTFLDLISPYVDGFDVSNTLEHGLIAKYQKKVSFYNPAPSLAFYNSIAKIPADLVMEGKTEIYPPGQRIARVDPTTFFDSKTLSRFGCRLEELKDFDKLHGVHFHIRELHEYSTSEILELVERVLFYRPDIELLNLGGGWHKVQDPENQFLILKSVRDHFPNLKLRIEPGRYFSYNTGYAVGTANQIIREKKLITSSLSSLVHLNWCEPMLETLKPATNSTAVNIFGPTCFEYDRLGTYEVDENWWNALKVYDRLLFSGLSSYVIQRQTSFNGIEPAKIIFT